MTWDEEVTAMRAGNGVRRKGWDAWLDMWQSGPIGEDVRMKTPLGYAGITKLNGFHHYEDGCPVARATARDWSGPAAVTSDAYRTGWDAINWGKRGQA